MNAFRGLLTVTLLVLGVYTGIVLFKCGPTLFQRFFGGIGFLSIYLLIMIPRSKGDVAVLLMGERATKRVA